jgi:hypothetical protein
MCPTESVVKLPATYLAIHTICNEQLRWDTDFLNTTPEK